MSVNPYQPPTPEIVSPKLEGLPAAEPGPFPPFCLRDWLVGGLLCLAVFALVHLQWEPLLPGFEPIARPNLAISFGHSAVWAAQAVVALTLLCLIVSRRTVHGFYAGHWLCWYFALPLLCDRLLPLVLGYNYLARELTTAGLFGAAVFAPAFLVRLPLSWALYFRVAFGIQCVHGALWIQGEYGRRLWLEGGEVVGHLVTGVVFLIALILELIWRERRDWAHWVGVLSPLATGMLVLLNSFLR